MIWLVVSGRVSFLYKRRNQNRNNYIHITILLHLYLTSIMGGYSSKVNYSSSTLITRCYDDDRSNNKNQPGAPEEAPPQPERVMSIEEKMWHQNDELNSYMMNEKFLTTCAALP